MPSPGFDDPAVAAEPPGGNLYFAQDVAVGSKIVGTPYTLYETAEQNPQQEKILGRKPSLMFGTGTVTGMGESVPMASKSARGHWSEILNFHGSPAPWVLLGLLLVLGILHLQGGVSGKAGVRI